MFYMLLCSFTPSRESSGEEKKGEKTRVEGDQLLKLTHGPLIHRAVRVCVVGTKPVPPRPTIPLLVLLLLLLLWVLLLLLLRVVA